MVEQREVDVRDAELREVLGHVAADDGRVGEAVGRVAEAGRNLGGEKDRVTLGASRLEDGGDVLE